MIIKGELDGIELVTRPVFSLGGSQTDNIFRAVQLSVPSVIAHLRVVHRGPDNNVLDSREYNFDLNSGRTFKLDFLRFKKTIGVEDTKFRIILPTLQTQFFQFFPQLYVI